MSETFDTEAILKDILDVLHKHGLPIQTAELNISLLDDDFEAVVHEPPFFMKYMDYIHRPKMIDGVPMLLHLQRRIPFDELQRWYETHIAPPLEKFTAQIQHEFPQFTTVFKSERKPTEFANEFNLRIETRLTDNSNASYNEIHLEVGINLSDLPRYPQIVAYVGWLVDPDDNGDWGVDVVCRNVVSGAEAVPLMLGMLEGDLHFQCQAFREELQKRVDTAPIIER